MSDAASKEDTSNQPRQLTAPLEILAALRPLMVNHVPLILRFFGHNSSYQSYLIEINTDYGLLALDELIPNDGELYMRRGIPFKVESFHEGVRIAWDNSHPVQQGELDDLPCHWLVIPDEVKHYQRRTAYRASLVGRQVPAQISDLGRNLELNGELVDISATGCKLRVSGNIEEQLQSGTIYENLQAQLPFGKMIIPVELRYVNHDEAQDRTFCGFRFQRVEGLLQRDLTRFITQLQREFRRNVI